MREKLVKGVGVLGRGLYASCENGKHTKEYNTWFDMISRCYDENYQRELPTYVGCSVVEPWHHFQVFAKWYTEHKNYGKKGYQIDKDLKYPGNKIYGPETCDLVPAIVNSSIIVPDVCKNSRYVGVHWCNRDKRFIAKIRVGNGKRRCQYFVNEDEAGASYLKMKSTYLEELAEFYKSELHPLSYENLKNWKVQ